MKYENLSLHWIVLLFVLCSHSPSWGLEPTALRNGENRLIKFNVQMRDGTVLNVQTPEASLTWNTVSRDGTISETEIPLANITSLSMAKNPASKKVAEIRRLVTNLANDDYAERHRSEKMLLQEGKPFAAVIEQAKDHAEPEVRYRVRRILNALAKEKASNVNQVALEFDRVVLSDQKVLEGDVLDWKLNCQWRDQPLTLDRESIISIQREPMADMAVVQTPAQTGVTRSLVRDDLFFDEQGQLRDGFIQAAFEKGPHGEDMVSDKNVAVDNYFAFLGCRFQCESADGRVIVSGFRFKQSRSARNSIGNFFVHPETGKDIRYQGTMRVDFCLPDRPDVPATVNQMGMFLEIVLPKHTILEAFNSSGHLLGVTQSGRERSSFVGLDTNLPIAYVRVRANEYLDVEKLNQDYAVDDVVFSRPVFAPEINHSPNYVVVTRDGQRLLAESVELSESHVFARNLSAGVDEIKLPIDEVEWVVGPHQPNQTNREDGAYVMTSGGSVLHVAPAMEFTLADQPAIKISEPSVRGYWGAGVVCRYPDANDFEQGKVVIVRPTNRVALRHVAIDAANLSAELDLTAARNLQQPMYQDEDEVLVEDANELHVGIDSGTNVLAMTESDSTVWFGMPPVRAENTGLLMTYDGQQFVIGGENGFALDKISQNSVVLSQNGNVLSFPVDKIRALQLPVSD